MYICVFILFSLIFCITKNVQIEKSKNYHLWSPMKTTKHLEERGNPYPLPQNSKRGLKN